MEFDECTLSKTQVFYFIRDVAEVLNSRSTQHTLCSICVCVQNEFRELNFLINANFLLMKLNCLLQKT